MREKFLVLTVLLLVVGCEMMAPKPATTSAPVQPTAVPPAPPPPPTPPPEPPKPALPAKTAAELRLDEGVALYDAGDFNGAVNLLLGARDLWTGPVPLKVKGYKYLAFSYCVTGRRTLCRQQFAEALKIDPTFVLEPAEKSHPIWGPQYEAAKKAATSSAPRPGGPATPSSGAKASPPPKTGAPTPAK